MVKFEDWGKLFGSFRNFRHFATLPLCHNKEVANAGRMARGEGNIIRILLYYNIIIF